METKTAKIFTKMILIASMVFIIISAVSIYTADINLYNCAMIVWFILTIFFSACIAIAPDDYIEMLDTPIFIEENKEDKGIFNNYISKN